MRVGLSVPIFLVALAAPAAAADRITVEAIQVRLLYEKTGKLSKDIAPPAEFAGHNTIIGEGDAEEPANDVLVTVVLAAPGEANGEQKLVVAVRLGKDKKVIVRIENAPEGTRISVIDNGVGIAPEVMGRLFAHGFTTRQSGHGFGLHSAALAAADLGGSLKATSDGVGRGAAFHLLLPDRPPESARG